MVKRKPAIDWLTLSTLKQSEFIHLIRELKDGSNEPSFSCIQLSFTKGDFKIIHCTFRIFTNFYDFTTCSIFCIKTIKLHYILCIFQSYLPSYSLLPQLQHRSGRSLVFRPQVGHSIVAVRIFLTCLIIMITIQISFDKFHNLQLW